jgi:hypothetical protein
MTGSGTPLDLDMPNVSRCTGPVRANATTP